MTLPTIPRWRRAFAIFRPSHLHSAFSATLLLMMSVTASRLIGLVRVKYIAWLLGQTAAADAFNAAFQLPEMIAYFLIGGAASTTFVTMLGRYRETGRKAEAERSLSVILTTMVLVLGAAVVLAELLTPLFVHTWFSGFPPEKAALCVHLTRIMLPSPILFFAGGIFGAVLLSRRIFSVQAVASPLFSLSIILSGLFFSRIIGVSALAVGALAGVFLGPFLLNAIGAYRAGTRYRPILDWSDPGLREWVGMSIPLILGVSLTQADTWIIGHFASRVGGAITLLTYAKQLFAAPVALGQAAGAASLPFLATLFTKGNFQGFSSKVNASVTRVVAFSLLVTAFMVAMAAPMSDALLRGGAFHRSDSGNVAWYFAIFALSLFAWSAMPLYTRAFYAAGNTVTPMVATTIVTIASIPIYWGLYGAIGSPGLAIASNIGIVLQVIVLATLLHWRRMVSLAGLEYGEMARALLASLVVFAVLAGSYHFVHTANRLWELALLAVATPVWLGVSYLVLRLTGSSLPGQLLERFAK
jgi:putative peptidoglycan lipid II flippase